MAVVYRSIGAQDYQTTGTTVSPGAPSGVVSGDLLLLDVAIIGDTADYPTDPTGWTKIDTQSYWFSGGRFHLYWRTADGTSADTPTVTKAGGISTSMRAVILRVDGHDPTTPIDTFTYVTDDSSPITHPTITVANADSLALILGWSFQGETGTFTMGNGFTERFGSSSGEAMWIGSKAVGAGATGTTDVTISTGLIRCGAMTLAIAPAAGGGSTYTLAANPGTYTVSGASATLAASKIIAADSGTYTYTGTAAVLNKGFSLTADSGAYAYTGTAANLVFASVGNFTLSADSGSYAYTGTAANLALSATLNADSGAYSYTGTAATLTRGFTLTANSGAYSYTGTAVDFSRNYVIGAESGSYVYNGNIVALTVSGLVWTQQSDVATTWTNQANSTTTWTIV